MFHVMFLLSFSIQSSVLMQKIVYDSADPFHEVKKKRDKRKEVWGFCRSFGLFMGFCVKHVY